jgi:GNAT superfamily N-acetyltransferase
MTSDHHGTPAITLVAMGRPRYDAWLGRAIREYAEGHVAAGNWRPEDALEQARHAFDDLLPDGVETAGQHLFSISDAEAGEVGVLWVGPRPNVAGALFIWDIEVNEEARGRGYGRAALAALDAWAREHGYERVGLHVFGSNDTARRLYSRAGYVETDVMMEKRL